MLERIHDLPEGLTGVRARGQVSKDDYERLLIPDLEEARRAGKRVRFLYEVGSDFEGFTPAAAWKDVRVGLRHLRLFERCAVVSDVGWISTAARAMSAVAPCPMEVFGLADRERAIAWLAEPLQASLDYRILDERGVLVVEPHGRLRAEDFDALEAAVDDWLDQADHRLQGLVVHAHEFPGWEGLGAGLRHLRFVRDHHRVIPRVAWAVDGKLARLAPEIAEHFVDAEIERFASDELGSAIAWASGADATGHASSAAT